MVSSFTCLTYGISKCHMTSGLWFFWPCSRGSWWLKSDSRQVGHQQPPISKECSWWGKFAIMRPGKKLYNVQRFNNLSQNRYCWDFWKTCDASGSLEEFRLFLVKWSFLFGRRELLRWSKVGALRGHQRYQTPHGNTHPSHLSVDENFLKQNRCGVRLERLVLLWSWWKLPGALESPYGCAKGSLYGRSTWGGALCRPLEYVPRTGIFTSFRWVCKKHRNIRDVSIYDSKYTEFFSASWHWMFKTLTSCGLATPNLVALTLNSCRYRSGHVSDPGWLGCRERHTRPKEFWRTNITYLFQERVHWNIQRFATHLETTQNSYLGSNTNNHGANS